MVKYNKYVNIRVFSLLIACIRSKYPCFQDGLCLEIMGYLLYHRLLTHI